MALASSVSWAHLSGPSSFRLVPGESRRVRVHIGQPPTGGSGLVAAFVAKDPSGSGAVATSAGVGTALRFAEPGRTVVAPCPVIHRAADHPAQLGATSEPSGIGAAPIALGGLLMLALGGLGGLLIARRRMT